MKKTRLYQRLGFRVETLQAGYERFVALLRESGLGPGPADRSVEVDGAIWAHDNLPEFWADCRKGGDFWLDVFASGNTDYRLRIEMHRSGPWTRVSVAGPSRAWIEDLFEVFEEGVGIAEPFDPPVTTPAPTVFLGHGGSPQWKELRDHLRDQHGYEVIAFESGARAGHAIRDILEDMSTRSSIAFLVLTAEDEAEDGRRARQNVVHELGLCQGKLGFHRGIALVEEGVALFSNLDGIQQIRYPQGRIRETFGDVLATIRREFQPPS